MTENEQLFIAPKIKVGFQNRKDTYTEKLAYVIYYDLNGVLRKEKSWESWRDKAIEPVEFDNVPTEGFVLNKKVGGGRSHWDARQEYVRVYDPRNFEFEITVPNLLFILKECDCSRGKGLEGKFVYAWSGTTLVLLPASSEEYKKSASYTNLQVKTIPAKELIKGASYLTKKQEKWIYLDRRIKHSMMGSWRSPKTPTELMYVFWDGKDFVFQKDAKKLAAVISDAAVPEYAELVELYDKSMYGSPPVRLFTKAQPAWKPDPNRYWHRQEWAKESNTSGVFHEYQTNRNYHDSNAIDSIQRTYEVSLQERDGVKFVNAESKHVTSYHPSNRQQRWAGRDEFPWLDPVDLGLWVELASGSQFNIRGAEMHPTTGDQDGQD